MIVRLMDSPDCKRKRRPDGRHERRGTRSAEQVGPNLIIELVCGCWESCEPDGKPGEQIVRTDMQPVLL